MHIEFSGVIFHWRGPAPYLFVEVPAEQCDAIKVVAAQVTYGWGVIPVRARIGETEWTTSLFPKNGRYLVPIRVSVQKAEGVGVGDHVTISLSIQPK